MKLAQASGPRCALQQAVAAWGRFRLIFEPKQARGIGHQNLPQLRLVRRVAIQKFEQLSIVRRLDDGNRMRPVARPHSGRAPPRYRRARSESHRPMADQPWRASRRATASPALGKPGVKGNTIQEPRDGAKESRFYSEKHGWRAAAAPAKNELLTRDVADLTNPEHPRLNRFSSRRLHNVAQTKFMTGQAHPP